MAIIKKSLLLIVLSAGILSCAKKTELDKAIYEYCDCAQSIEKIPVEFYGADEDSLSNALFNKVEELSTKEEESFEQKKRMIECSGIIAKASERRYRYQMEKLGGE